MAILSCPITTAMFPMFSKMDPKSQKSYLAREFVLAVKYTSLLMIPRSVAVIVFSRDLPNLRQRLHIRFPVPCTLLLYANSPPNHFRCGERLLVLRGLLVFDIIGFPSELRRRERLMIQVKKPNGAIAKPMIPTSSTRQFNGGNT
jgi:hypothetical protein